MISFNSENPAGSELHTGRVFVFAAGIEGEDQNRFAFIKAGAALKTLACVEKLTNSACPYTMKTIAEGRVEEQTKKTQAENELAPEPEN